MLVRLKHLVPLEFRLAVRPKLQAIRYPVADVLNWLRGRDRDRLPPFVGEGDFQRIGQEFLSHFKRFGLQPHHRVLDVGCGIGRMALPLTHFLKGEYYGFDIVKKEVTWCQDHITARFPHFHFSFADIYNRYYNPKGGTEASAYKFPYPDEFFDFTFATSVFTHLQTAGMESYLSEIARVTKASGRSLITWFIVNDEVRSLMKAGRSSVELRKGADGTWLASASHPEYMVGFEEQMVRRAYEKNGLRCRIHYGFWAGRDKGLSHQDIVMASESSDLVDNE